MNQEIKNIKDLVEKLNKYAYHYYVLDNPIISDFEYDKLYDELQKIEKETGVVLPNSPTKRVGGEILNGFKKFNHYVPLYSLDKCNSYEDIKLWIDKIKKEFNDSTFSLEYKFDGLSIVIEYEDGYLTKAGTRGNGKIGEDVTAQVKTIKSIPLSIDFKGKLIIQGEGMIKLSNLDKYNKKTNEPLKNARNAVSGAIRNLDPKETAKRNLDLFAYSVNYAENLEFETQEEMQKFLIKNGFKTSKFFKICKDYQEIINYIDEVDATKNSLDILIDGMVIKLNEIKNRDELGYTSKFPKWAIAYKFEAQEISTILEDVKWQVGRTGKLTPIAILKPIYLAGAKISRATLNNIQDINRKRLKLGARVFVRRSNEVIPEILGLAEDNPNSQPIMIPNQCPSCGGKLSEIGVNIYCTNVDCPEQIVDSLTHFCSKEAMNIEGLSEKTITQLYRKLNIKNISDIFELTYDDLTKLENFKSKKINNLLNSIEKSKNVSLSAFIYSLGIKNVGLKTSKDLVKKYKNIDNLINASLQSLNDIEDIGEIVAKNIYEYFQNDKNIKELDKLLNKGINIIEEKVFENKYFSDKIIVLTGSLKKFSRSEATKLIEGFGGIVSSNVNKKTNLVICGENPGNKIDKAKSLGIKIINEDEFLNIIKNS